MGKGIVKGLSHIGVFVKDMERSIDFYKRLGFTLDNRESIHVELAFLSAGTCLIELIEQKDVTRSAGVVDHIAMEVDDIDAAIARFKENGIAIDADGIISRDILGGIRHTFFEGPDGERLELFEHTGR
ncbi:MAG: VOC family protein [Defluviitaleaceae bacterium]|nr:VOC family protein [Defluviitaleaceae bacterium]